MARLTPRKKALIQIVLMKLQLSAAYGQKLTPSWIAGPFKPGVKVGKRRMMRHAMFALERAEYIALNGRMSDPYDKAGMALCIGVACASALSQGVTLSYDIPMMKIYPAINLPSVMPKRQKQK